MSDRVVRIERTFDAPVERVFDAWVNPEVMRRWFHRDPDWETPVVEVDLRIGGQIQVVMRRPDGLAVRARSDERDMDGAASHARSTPGGRPTSQIRPRRHCRRSRATRRRNTARASPRARSVPSKNDALRHGSHAQRLRLASAPRVSRTGGLGQLHRAGPGSEEVPRCARQAEA